MSGNHPKNQQVSSDNQADRSFSEKQSLKKTRQVISGSGFDKESGPLGSRYSETIKYIEVETSPEVPLEVQEYVQKTDSRNQQLNTPVIHRDQPLVSSSDPHQAPNIELPLTKQGVLSGLDAPITSAWKWLSNWCVRVIKKFKGRVTYSSRSDGYDS